MKNLRTLTLCFFAVFIFSCKKNDNTATTPNFSDVKSSDWRSNIGDTVDVVGFIKLNDDGTGVLMANKGDFDVNGLIPEERTISLGSENIRGLSQATYYLAKVKVRGVIRATTEPGRTTFGRLTGDDLSQFELKVVVTPVIIEPSPGIGTVLDWCSRNPTLCTINTTVSTKYALLYSGGINPDKAYDRYWNDMSLYYNMLVYIYGYDPDNIIVVYKNGVALNNSMPVGYAATPAGLNSAFSALGDMMDSNDQFFFFMTNHGGQITDVGSPVPNDEDFGSDNIDECTFYYSSAGRPYDDDIAAKVNSLSFNRMICVMEQCFSGGMIYDLRGTNRIIMTAANEVEVSYGGAKFDDFCMLLASALIKTHQESRAAVNADADNNGQVSLTEAFRWATDNDNQPEHPQYEDSGEGIPIGYPSDNGAVMDGAKGKIIYGL